MEVTIDKILNFHSLGVFLIVFILWLVRESNFVKNPRVANFFLGGHDLVVTSSILIGAIISLIDEANDWSLGYFLPAVIFSSLMILPIVLTSYSFLNLVKARSISYFLSFLASILFLYVSIWDRWRFILPIYTIASAIPYLLIALVRYDRRN